MIYKKRHQILTFFLIASFCFFISSALRFNEQGEFTVLQFTDFHYCEEDLLDVNTQKLTRQMLKWVQPDFVMVSGDGVSGYGKGHENPGFYKTCWEKFTAPIVEAKVMYGFTVGNHDSEADLTSEEIIRLDSTSPFSIRNQSEGIEGKGTFHIPIYSSRNSSEVSATIWVFDSGREGCEGVENTWGCITEDQIEWYDKESQKVRAQYGVNMQHIAFFHIPIPEYMLVYNNEKIYGVSDDGVGCPLVNTKFFEHIIKNGDITATFVGHDHNSDFGGWHQGVELVYGRKSGYGGYGTLRGARVIKFKEYFNAQGKLSVTRSHYVIYENGTIGRTEPVHYREGPKQNSCATPNSIHTLEWDESSDFTIEI